MGAKRDSPVIGIDLGGTKILTAVVTPQGKILSRDHSVTPAKEGPEAVVRSITESTGRALNEAGMAAADLAGIGIGAPGISNPETGILFTSPNLPGWHDVPIRDIIEKQLGSQAFLINDANAAALGEFHFGAGKGTRNIIYITVSTGIGGGIIIDSRNYTGSIGTAGELGHMVIADNGPQCACGNKGCWETLASGTALAREARQRIHEGATTSILKYVDGESKNINAEAVHEAARAGDELANELIAGVAYYLGVGLANLINIFNPEKIIIGGGLSNIGDLLLRPAYEEAGRRAFQEPYQAVRFARPELGHDSGVLGAAAYALEKRKD